MHQRRANRLLDLLAASEDDLQDDAYEQFIPALEKVTDVTKVRETAYAWLSISFRFGCVSLSIILKSTAYP